MLIQIYTLETGFTWACKFSSFPVTGNVYSISELFFWSISFAKRHFNTNMTVLRPFLRNVVSVFCACGLNSETATKTKHNYSRNRVGVAFKDMFSYVAIPKNDRGQFPTQHNPIIMVRLAVAHVRHRASLTSYRFTSWYWRETRFTWNTVYIMFRELLLHATFMQVSLF